MLVWTFFTDKLADRDSALRVLVPGPALAALNLLTIPYEVILTTTEARNPRDCVYLRVCILDEYCTTISLNELKRNETCPI